MVLSAMRFKDYVWPHNPEKYQVSFRRKLAVHKVPFGGTVMQDLGCLYRVMEGEGEFVGIGAYEEFKKLLAVFSEGGAGLLVHPVWETEHAHFAELELVEEPRSNYVRYRFVFWEDSSYSTELAVLKREEQTQGQGQGQTEGQAARRTHTVVSGDTLWGISRRYGVSLSDVIALNPQIKNPNLIYPGEQVVIS